MRGIQPALDMEAEVLSAGVAVHEKRMDGKQSSQRQQDCGVSFRWSGGLGHDSL
jgi:hypothetical protein